MEGQSGDNQRIEDDTTARLGALEGQLAHVTEMILALTEAMKGKQTDASAISSIPVAIETQAETNNPLPAYVNPKVKVNETVVVSTPDKGASSQTQITDTLGHTNRNVGDDATQGYPGDDPVYTLQIPASKIDKEDKTLKEEIGEVKDQLRALREPVSWGSLELDKLCLTPEITIPKEFKMPEFSKYDGTRNPIYHLRSYCTKMCVWSRNEKFLINFFPESLTGAALLWFMQLDQSKVQKWGDLADLFMKQYKFNLQTAPTREQLKAMTKKNSETFKEYAQRWRVMASQVQPPLIQSEFCSYFIRTLPDPFYRIMLGTHVTDFADLIEIGERIDADIREGKLSSPQVESSSKKGQPVKKKEDDVNYVQPVRSYPQQQSYSYQANSQGQSQVGPNRHTQVGGQRGPQLRDNRPWPKLHTTCTKLYERLIAAKLLGPRPWRPINPPYPTWYDPNVSCIYHMGAVGHSIENCNAFKRNVLELIDAGYLEVEALEDTPVMKDPLPNYER